MQRELAVLLWLASLANSAALALDRNDISIEKQDRAYVIHTAFDVPASVYQIMSVITDYRNPQRLNQNVTDRDIISERHGITRMITEFRGCALFFCRTMVLIQDVKASGASVRADVVPGDSDFRSGLVLWSIADTGRGESHVVLEVVMEPNFFLPPFIGELLVRRAIRKQIVQIAQSLVREAALEPPAPQTQH